MWLECEFEATLWTGGTEPARKFLTRDVRELTAPLGAGPLLLEVDAVLRRPTEAMDVSLGYFWFGLNGQGMAWVRVDEHREHFARDPSRASLPGEVSGFPESGGGEFKVQAADAIIAAQARLALACWLENGAWWSGLEWD